MLNYGQPRFTISTVVIADDLPRMGKAAIRKASLLEHAEMGHLDLDQVDSDGRRWRRFHIGGQDYQVNMSVLEPYLQVLSHGGELLWKKLSEYTLLNNFKLNWPFFFYRVLWWRINSHHYVYRLLPTRKYNRTLWVCDGQSVQVKADDLVWIFSTSNYTFLELKCFSLRKCTFNDLFGFRYIIGTLDLMVSENYILVYLCGMAPRNKMPGIKWLRQCYMSIDRRWAILEV